MTDIQIAAPLAAALASKGYETLTPVQSAMLGDNVTGRDLLHRIRAAQTGAGRAPAAASVQPQEPEHAGPADAPPLCPVCAAAMLQRLNRRTREPFWGCARYPQCKGTATAPPNPDARQ